MSIIRFESVSKHYRLRKEQDRPRSLREIFIGRWLKNLPKMISQDRLWALRDVSFEIERGETVGLIGANGAGKSTALKLISRVVMPNSGKLTVLGRVAALLELGTGFHPDLSGRDNIFLSGALAGMSRAEIKRKFASIVEFSELEEFIDMPVKHYSSGMFARLAFAVSIHLDPEILLVDEVLAVGDQAFQQKCLERIAELRRTGITIFFVSHSLETVRSLCARALWVDRGRLRADGATAGVVQQYLDSLTGHEPTAQTAIVPAEHRYGNRKVEIVQLKITDAQGGERQTFRTGDSLQLHIAYSASKPVSAPIFGLAIIRRDGVHICGPNTAFAGLSMSQVSGRGSVTYSIPYLPLLDGLYDISLSITDSTDTEFYDHYDRAFNFRVANGKGGFPERYGLMTLRGEWQHVALSR